MATKLKNMKLTSVDLVRAGANQEADIGLFKSAGPQAEYDEALVKSARSILEDPDLTEDQQAGMLAKSVDDYRAALEEPEDEPDGEEVMVEKEPEEEEPEDLDEIEEVEKYNHNHAADGKFTFSEGGSSGGGGGSHGSKVQWHTQGHDWWPDKTKRPSKKPEGRIEYHLAPKKPKDSGRRKDPWNDMKFNVPTPRPGAHDGSTGPRWDPKEDERMVFLPGGGKTKKSAFTSGVQYDMITEVRKFNPFHDALGRFASKNGFKTYSANPKMKVAQPSIIRSAQAGHGHTMNVHRESKGENIGQNYDWLQTGQKPAGVVSTPPKPPRPQKPQKPKQPKTDPNTKTLTPVEGRDLVAELGADAVKKMTIDEILQAQGYDGLPRIADSESSFADALAENGNVCVRSWDGAGDPTDVPTMQAYDDDLKHGDFYTKCEGGNALGRGMYAALSTADGQGRIDYERAFDESLCYGPWHVNMTVDKSAKLISLDDARALAQQKGFNSDNWADKDIGDEDIGAFAAAMGYDGVIGWPGKTGTLEDNIKTIHMSGTYVNLVNRTKVTVYDNSGFENEGDLRQTTGMVNSQNGCINVNAIQGNPLF